MQTSENTRDMTSDKSCSDDRLSIAKWNYMCRLHRAGVLHFQFNTPASKSLLMHAYQQMFQPVVQLYHLRPAQLKKYTHLRKDPRRPKKRRRRRKRKSTQLKRNVITDDLPTIEPPKRRRASCKTRQTGCAHVFTEYTGKEFDGQQMKIKAESDHAEQLEQPTCNIHKFGVHTMHDNQGRIISDNSKHKNKYRKQKFSCNVDSTLHAHHDITTATTITTPTPTNITTEHKSKAVHSTNQAVPRSSTSVSRVSAVQLAHLDVSKPSTLRDVLPQHHSVPDNNLFADLNKRQSWASGHPDNDAQLCTAMSSSIASLDIDDEKLFVQSVQPTFQAPSSQDVNTTLCDRSSTPTYHASIVRQQSTLDVNTETSQAQPINRTPRDCSYVSTQYSHQALPTTHQRERIRLSYVSAENFPSQNQGNITNTDRGLTGIAGDDTNNCVSETDVLSLVNRSIVLQHEYRRCRRDLLRVHRMALLRQNQHRFLKERCRKMEKDIHNIEQTMSNYQLMQPKYGSLQRAASPFALKCNDVQTTRLGNHLPNYTRLALPSPAVCTNNEYTCHSIIDAGTTQMTNIDSEAPLLANSVSHTNGPMVGYVPLTTANQRTEDGLTGPLSIALLPCKQTNTIQRTGLQHEGAQYSQICSSVYDNDSTAPRNTVLRTTKMSNKSSVQRPPQQLIQQQMGALPATQNGYYHVQPLTIKPMLNTDPARKTTRNMYSSVGASVADTNKQSTALTEVGSHIYSNGSSMRFRPVVNTNLAERTENRTIWRPMHISNCTTGTVKTVVTSDWARTDKSK